MYIFMNFRFLVALNRISHLSEFLPRSHLAHHNAIPPKTLQQKKKKRKKEVGGLLLNPSLLPFFLSIEADTIQVLHHRLLISNTRFIESFHLALSHKTLGRHKKEEEEEEESLHPSATQVCFIANTDIPECLS